MSDIRVLEAKLRRRLRPEDRGRIQNLNEVPAKLIEEARSLGSGLLVRDFLSFYTSPDCHSYLKPFIDRVVLGGERVDTWLRGRVLVPALSLKDQLTMTQAQVSELLGGPSFARTVPDLDAWKAGVAWVGAPALPQPEADYRTPTSDKTASLSQARTEPVSDAEIAFRRWIAGRIAMVLRAKGTLRSDLSLLELQEGLPDARTWTADSALAARGLLRELRGQFEENGVPGFRAPDDFYR